MDEYCVMGTCHQHLMVDSGGWVLCDGYMSSAPVMVQLHVISTSWWTRGGWVIVDLGG